MNIEISDILYIKVAQLAFEKYVFNTPKWNTTFHFTTSHSGQELTYDITKLIRNVLMYRCR